MTEEVPEPEREEATAPPHQKEAPAPTRQREATAPPHEEDAPAPPHEEEADSPATPAAMRPGRAILLLIAVVVAGFVAWSWPLAGNLSTHTIVRDGAPEGSLTATPGWDLLLANDQNLSLWGAAENARALLELRWGQLLWQGQCYPMPEATALGEHMFELGVLAAPWWGVTSDPVFSYNLALLTSLFVGAVGMFLFLYRSTGSVPAAIAGGIAFAFAAPRLSDLPYHPAVVGTHWIPWVLWCFDRVLDGTRRASTLGLAITLLLACMVGAYPLLAVAMVASAYGAAGLVVRYRRGELRAHEFGWCVAAVVPPLVVTGYVLFEFARVQQLWALPLNPDAKLLISPRDLLPGGMLSAGLFALLGLVPLALLRGPRGTAVLPGLVAATLLTFVLVAALPLPGGTEWSFYGWLAAYVPLLDSVRAPAKAGLAVCFGLQALGAIGWSRCFERTTPGVAAAVAAALLGVTALEALPPSWLSPVLGFGAPVTLRETAPPASHIAAVRRALDTRFERRPVLDLPAGRMVRAPVALLDAAYHGRPTSACYNTLVPPTVRAVDALAARRHRPEGVAELAAAGFGYVIERPISRQRPPDPEAFAAPAKLVVYEPGLAIWRLPYPKLIHRDPSRLDFVATGGLSRDTASTMDPEHAMDVEVTNRGEQMWVARRPLSPLVAEVEFVSPDGTSTLRARARGVLPLALSPGATTTMKLELESAPPAGPWKPTLHVPGHPAVPAPGDSSFTWTDERRPR